MLEFSYADRDRWRGAPADAGLDPGAVTFVNAHGTGTPHNDVSEARALSEVFGARAHSLPVTAAKGSIGHLLGSSGAVEAVATVLALLDRAIQPTPGADPADPELGVDLVVGEPRPIAAASVGISTSFAFGGANAAVVGVLLAAGAGIRFGGGKLLAPLPDGTPIGVRSARVLRGGVDRGVAVLREGDVALAGFLEAEGLAAAFFPGAADGMGASLAFGISSAPDADGWVVALADMPFLRPGTVARVVARLRAGAWIVAPSHLGRRGHPVGFARSLFPELVRLGVELIEQPFPPRRYDWLLDLQSASPLPIVADESAVAIEDLDALVGIVDGVNVKLAKCGGVAPALALIAAARAHGMKVLLGCMIESSLGIAAALAVAPLVDWVDLDGHLLIDNDPFTGLGLAGGRLVPSDAPGLGVEPVAS